MITGFLLKIVLGLALTGVLLFEALGPLVVRGQLDGAANDAADSAALALRDGKGVERAEREAREAAGDRLTRFEVAPDGLVRVVLEQEADSIVVKRYVAALRSWYQVKIEATASSQ